MTRQILTPASQRLMDNITDSIQELRWHMTDREITAAIIETLRDTVRPNPPVPSYNSSSNFRVER